MKRIIPIVLIICLFMSIYSVSFTITVSAAEASGGEIAEISYITNSADSGTPFTIIGENLDKVTEVWLWVPGADTAATRKLDEINSLPNLPEVPSAAAVKVNIISQPNSHTLIAKGIGENYFVERSVTPTVVWLKSEGGFSKPFIFNKPDLYFTSTDKVVPGQDFSIYGMDLINANTNPTTGLVMFKNIDTNAVFWGTVLTTSSQNRPNKYQYSWDVKVPNNITPGNYKLLVHNLNGGPNAWSNSLSISVTNTLSLVEVISKPLSYGTTTPVFTLDKHYLSREISKTVYESVYEATYSTFGDYIQANIDEVSTLGGGTITLPAGSIEINKPIIVKNGVVLQGNGAGSTEVKINPLVPLNNVPSIYINDKPMIVLYTNTGIQNLSIIVGNGAQTAITVDSKTNPNNVFIKKTIISNMQEQNTANVFPTGVSVLGVTNSLTLIGNEITACRPLVTERSNLTPHKYSYIVGNKFDGYPNNNSYTAVTMLSLSDSVFEYNEISDATRGFVNQAGMWRNWVYNNTFTNIGGIANGNEVILPENNAKGVTKSVTSATYNSINIDSPVTIPTYYPTLKDGDILKYQSQFYVYVLTGRGMGQFRKVVNNVGNTLSISEPWNVIPDNTSKVAVVGHVSMSYNNLFVNNIIKDTRGTTMIIWGFAVENSIVGNELYNAGSMMERSLVQSPPANMTIYNYTANNLLVNSGNLILTNDVTSKYKLGEEPIYDSGNVFANSFVRNQVISPSTSTALNQYSNVGVFDATQTGAISIKNSNFNIFSGNYVYNAENGIVVENGIGNVFYSNKLERISGDPITLNGSDTPYLINPTGEIYSVKEIPAPPRVSENTTIVRPNANTSKNENIAAGSPVFSSFLPSPVRPISRLTDGLFDNNNYFSPSVPGPQYVQIDLGNSYDISKIKLWHYFSDGRNYKNVIIQLSNTSDFSSKVVTIYNNDNDNSSGQGIGTDSEYYENANGLDLNFKAVNARYVRCWVDGNSVNAYSHWTELQVFESTVQADIGVESIIVSGQGDIASITVDKGTLQMNAVVQPANAPQSVAWAVCNQDNTETQLANIDSTGLLTAKGDGIVKVVATSTGGTNVKGEMLITITNQVLPAVFNVTTPVLSDLMGNAVSVLSPSRFVKAATSIENITNESQSAILLIALYAPDGSLQNLSTIEKEIAAGAKETISSGIMLPSNVEGYKIKAFVWKSLANPVPLSNQAILN